ncbi:metal ABC transporter ATP-binding protein [Streptococcus caviae]|uniref:metal ABC transporter ATP-binding protein n=1 Tax=Streptococcus sp. 'caviae' TaxID=1915004 RepID=UPI00094BB43A|nr:metal ABC transporter ATP-binding protein [Streptococcus sp. 'caviae']OLN82560.1 manganese ABC transporter ATP-binding protein [Streptococcus sp. 'caviae']
MLKIENLSVAYQNRLVLDHVSLEITPSAITGIIGPNGAGKSTLFKGILGMVDHQGDSFIDGKRLNQMLEKVSYVEQKADIDPNFPIRVKDCVALGLFDRLAFFSRLKKQDWRKVEEALTQVNLADYAERPINQLSGGQFQRMLIARCLVQEADYIFLDEPFAGIDTVSEETIMKILQELKAKGKTILVIHHDLSKVEAYFDQVLLLNQKVLAFGPAKDVFTPANLSRTYGSSFLVGGGV